MRTLVFCLLLAFLFAGCADHPDGWEFVVSIPGDTTPERLMEIRQDLEKHGYKRFKIFTVDWGRAIIVCATRTDESKGGAK